MHVKVTNGVIEKYPYSIGDLRKDNPQTSFPKNPSDKLLEEWGVFRVEATSQPNIDYTKNMKEGTPVNNNGWKQVWVVTDATADEIATRKQDMANSIRSERDRLLADSDWTQVADAPVDKSAWATYRQALRNVPEQPEFPLNVNWPVAP